LTVFVDSNILIYSNIEEYPEYRIASKKLEEILKKNKIFLNSIIVSEVFHKLFRIVNLKKARDRTLDIISMEDVIYLPIEKETVKKAIDISFKHKIRINDAVIAQHVLDSKAEGILTDNVKDFKKISGLYVISLR